MRGRGRAVVDRLHERSRVAERRRRSAQLTAPAIDAPADDEQLTTLRPTLVVRNGTSSGSGARTYEFQLSTSSSFASINLSRAGIAENASGRTSLGVDTDLQSTTRYYWRARVTQGSSNSDWSSMGRFRTKVAGYNNAGELFDPLVAGETVGTPVGAHTWVAGKGIKLDSALSYVRYALPATVAAGEFSMEIEGAAPNGPVGKPRLFSMLNGTGRLDLSKYQMNVQYRGRQGNPDNAIAFKAVWGDEDVKLEPELHERIADVRLLDPARTYYWQATWDSLTFRLIVREDGVAGREIYNRAKTSPAGYGPVRAGSSLRVPRRERAGAGRRRRHGAGHRHSERVAREQVASGVARQRAPRSVTTHGRCFV